MLARRGTRSSVNEAGRCLATLRALTHDPPPCTHSLHLSSPPPHLTRTLSPANLSRQYSILHALRSNPSRLSSPHSMHGGLKPTNGTRAFSSTTPPNQPSSSPSSSSSSTLPIVAGVTIIAGGAAGGYFWWEGEKAKWGPGPVIPPVAKSSVTQSNVSVKEGGETQESAPVAPGNLGGEVLVDETQGEGKYELERDSVSHVEAHSSGAEATTNGGRSGEGRVGGTEATEEAAGVAETGASDSGAAALSDDAESAVATAEPQLAAAAGAAVGSSEAERSEAERVIGVFEVAKEAAAEAARIATGPATASESSSSSSSSSRDIVANGDVRLGEEASGKESGARAGLGAAELARLVFYVAEEARAEQRARDEREGTIRLQMVEASYLSETQQLLQAIAEVAGEVDAVQAEGRERLSALQRQLARAKEEAEQRQLEEEEQQRLASHAAVQAAVHAVQSQGQEEVEREGRAFLEEKAGVLADVEALNERFYARSEEAREACFAHRLALVAMSLQTAAETNSPIGPLLSELVTTSTPNDPTSFVSHEREEEEELVRALVSSMPARVLANGVATRQQLEESFAAMKGNLGLLALLPSKGDRVERDGDSGGRDVRESGGMLSYLVASLASRLKIPEPAPVLQGGGVDALLARAQSLLLQGSLVEAATELEAGLLGTRAELAASDWAQSVRDRVAVEQAARVLQAEAHVLALHLR